MASSVECSLMRAILHDDTNVLKELIASESGLCNRQLSCGVVPLELALACSPACLRMLLGSGADLAIITSSMLPFIDEVMLAPCNYGGTAKLKILLDAGMSPDVRTSDGDTSLLMLSAMTNFDAVELLLSYGADPSLRSKSGDNALMFAVSYDAAKYKDDDCERVVEALLRAGASANDVNNMGHGVLDILRVQMELSDELRNRLSSLIARYQKT